MRAASLAGLVGASARACAGALLLLLAACGEGERDASSAGATSPPRAAPAAGRPSFALISIDTLRADHLGVYGHARDTSPHLDAFARSGAVFETAVANSPWTLPSHASLLTGLYPRTHGVKASHLALRPDVPTLAERFQAAGYATAALVDSHFLAPRYGFRRGFDVYRRFDERRGEAHTRVARREVADAIEWIRGLASEQPFFLFLHNYDLHSPYDPDPEYRRAFADGYEGTFTGTTAELKQVRDGARPLGAQDLRHLVDLYDAGIRQLDAELAVLFDDLERSGRARSTYVIVVADHGEEFLEHGGVLHGRTMYEELLAVPLLVAGPGVEPGRRIAGLVQLSDVAPTLLGLAGLAAPPMDGLDLSPVLLARAAVDPARSAYGEADHHNAAPDVMRMVRVGDTKLIQNRETGSVEVYDLREDPGEQRDRSAVAGAAAERLRAALERYGEAERAAREVGPPSKAEREHLRALGYAE